MSSVGRSLAGVRASARSFAREPFTVAILVLLPPVSIQIFGLSIGQFPDIGLFETTASLETMGRITGAVFAAGALAGVLALFQMTSARSADRRLVLAGFRGPELLGARFVTVALASVVVSAVSTVSLALLSTEPIGSPPGVFVGLLLAGAMYGCLGTLVGSVLPRELEGSLVLVMLADVDNIVASGMFGIDQSITRFAPLSHPHAIVTEAAVEGTIATAHLLPALGQLSLIAVLGVGPYAWQLTAGGGS